MLARPPEGHQQKRRSSNAAAWKGLCVRALSNRRRCSESPEKVHRVAASTDRNSKVRHGQKRSALLAPRLAPRCGCRGFRFAWYPSANDTPVLTSSRTCEKFRLRCLNRWIRRGQPAMTCARNFGLREPDPHSGRASAPESDWRFLYLLGFLLATWWAALTWPWGAGLPCWSISGERGSRRRGRCSPESLRRRWRSWWVARSRVCQG